MEEGSSGPRKQEWKKAPRYQKAKMSACGAGVQGPESGTGKEELEGPGAHKGDRRGHTAGNN